MVGASGGPVSQVMGRACGSLPNSQPIDELFISIEVQSLEVVQETPALAHEFQESTPGMMILLVGFEVLGEVTDSVTQDSNLDLRRARVGPVQLVIFDQSAF